MKTENIYNQIAETEREIAVLPEGNLTKKKIRDRDYYYLRITRDGKRIENYVSFEQVPDLNRKIEKRKELEKKLKELKRMLPKEEQNADRIGAEELSFKTKVRTGKQLESQIAITRKYKKRECISILREYIFGPVQDKVLILYTLRFKTNREDNDDPPDPYRTVS